jgi:hypothetical protein
LTLSERISGGLVARRVGTGLQFANVAGGGGVLLRYGGLSAVDASGRSLPARLELHGRTVVLAIDDAHARYPITVDPLIQQGPKLTPNDETGQGAFGGSVALSADGSTAIIGGPSDNGPGAAWVFTRSGSTWTQQGPKLTAGNGEFGVRVALSADGTTALIGGDSDNGGVGAAWVFTRSGSEWTQQGPKLVPGTGYPNFGTGVALSADGNTALIGGLNNQTNGENAVGAAWVFTRSGSTWTQQGSKLTPSDEVGQGLFGSSVALSGDGDTALIGGFGDNGVGAAWVFTRSGGAWTQQGSKLTADDETGVGAFGDSVALAADGETALIGGDGDNGDMGAAWVFTRSGSTWTQEGAKLTANDERGNGGFGGVVALSGDGSTALVGGDRDNGDVGAAWVFTPSGSIWTQQGSKLTAAGETGQGIFGGSVALSSDGSTALIGGPRDNSVMGAAWAFSDTPRVTLSNPSAGSATNETQPTFSGSAGIAPGDSGSVTVELYAGSYASGTPMQTLTAPVGSDGSYSVQASSPLTDGIYTAEAQQSEASGRIGFSFANSFTVDTVAPVVSLTSPADGSSTNQTRPSFSGTGGLQRGDSGSVRVDVYAGSSATGTPVQTLTASVGSDGYSVPASSVLGDGQYTVRAHQSDAAGNVGFSSANTFTIDTVAPVVSLTSPANGGRTNQSEPTFNGTAGTLSGDSGSVTVDLYRGSSATGTPVQTLTASVGSDGSYSVQASAALTDGRYTAQASQSDAVGNVGLSSANTFTLATVPPPTVSLNSPGDGSSIDNAEPMFTGVGRTLAQDAPSVTVRVYAGSGASGTPIQTLTAALAADGSYSAPASAALADGQYTAQAEQTDAAGDTGFSSANTFTVDTVAPVLTIESPGNGTTDHYRAPAFSGAAGAANGDQPQITITVYAGTNSSAPVVQTMTATASGGAWSAQSGALTNGTYTAVAEQTDLAGNTGSTSSTFTLDATPPHTVISSGPPSTVESPSASFSFFATVEGSTFQCQLDGGGWSSCSSPVTYSGLSDGQHTFQVRATDPWGNTDQSPASQTWTIDTSPPHTVITSSPANPTRSTTATLVFFSTAQGSTFQCRLDDSAWTACRSPRTYTNVSAGEHAFAVRATDTAGLTDPTPASTSWTVGSFVLSSGDLTVIAGTPAGHRLLKPTVNLKTGVASIGTAFCSPRAKHACTINLRLSAPGLTSATTAVAARASHGLTLGSVRRTLKPGHRTTLQLRLARRIRTRLKTSKRFRARAIFTLARRRLVTRTISFAVSHSRPHR